MRSVPDASGVEGLTAGQVSARLGVTVRALHHWDGRPGATIVAYTCRILALYRR